MVIPCYRAGSTVRDVIARIGAIATRVYVVDDCCPDRSGALVLGANPGPRVKILSNDRNLGVGGAMKRGYAEALRAGMDVIVKIDADGQMDPAFIDRLIEPILAGAADYAKGNRFGPAHHMPRPASGGERPMPPMRRLGNNFASFLHKGVTGYWNIFDPANGFTAIHARALRCIDLDAVADCYFFETDMLFQLNLAEAVVADVPIPASYGGEVSSLSFRRIFARFPRFALGRFARRVWIQYFLRDFTVASLEILLGLPLFLFGVALGLYQWLYALDSGIAATAGTVMFAALPIILGFQLLLSAVSYDVARRPATPISRQSEPD